MGFHGAAGEVTGSRHLVEVEGLKILLDCGLFQGHRSEAIDRNRKIPFDPKTVDAVLLSHAHVDHCGGLPFLTKNGYRGPIHCTEITAELTSLMLLDSARLQEADAFYFNKLHSKAATGQSIGPLYTESDARVCSAQLKPQPFDAWIPLSDKVRFRFTNSGHVIGAAMIEIEAQTAAGKRKLAFTGDLGRRETLLMDAPKPPTDTDVLLIESTYGDRVHESLKDIEPIVQAAVERAISVRGKILVPSFALERTQEILFVLDKMIRHKQIPPIPIYVDSPMAITITEIFDKHLDSSSFSQEFHDYICKEGDPFALKSVSYTRTPEESRALNEKPGPMIILSASGMCEGGRILHHLRNNIDKKSTTVLIVGYQAQGTLGRKIQEGATKVKIFGFDTDVRAQVQTIHTFSAHADRDDLLWFMKTMAPRPKRIFLVHGDPEDRAALSDHLKREGFTGIDCPDYGQVFDVP
jgi:metallo-beta-lactamase family protein